LFTNHKFNFFAKARDGNDRKVSSAILPLQCIECNFVQIRVRTRSLYLLDRTKLTKNFPLLFNRQNDIIEIDKTDAKKLFPTNEIFFV
jgi:hypothetical protein